VNATTLDASIRDLLRDVLREVVREELRERRNASPAPLTEDSYVSVTKAARIADVAPGTIRAWIRAGRLTGKHAGRVLRISRMELERFMRSEATGPSGREVKQRAAHLFGHAKRLRSNSV
jgi:excisionase family DNA binding protein